MLPIMRDASLAVHLARFFRAYNEMPEVPAREHATMDVGGWLRSLGLSQYESAFIENAIDSDVLPELTEGDLERLGIPLGDRKRLIKAIRVMLADSPGAFTASGVRGDAQSGQFRVADAERRHLTVMICDLVGSTALSSRLDP